MAYWLVKSEPETWSWADQERAGTTHWDGVRNHQAANSLKAMQPGDLALFYHSGRAREIVGVVRVVRGWYPDAADADGRFGMVDVTAVRPLPTPVPLAAIKAEARLAQLALVRQSRLSVMPVDAEAWAILTAMGGLPTPP